MILANKFPISEGSVIPSTAEACDLDCCTNFFTSNQKPSILLSEYELENKNLFRRLIRRTECLYCFLVFFLISKRVPEEGRTPHIPLSLTLTEPSSRFLPREGVAKGTICRGASRTGNAWWKKLPYTANREVGSAK